jgi:hypothetical protein
MALETNAAKRRGENRTAFPSTGTVIVTDKPLARLDVLLRHGGCGKTKAWLNPESSVYFRLIETLCTGKAWAATGEAHEGRERAQATI